MLDDCNKYMVIDMLSLYSVEQWMQTNNPL